MPRIAISYRRDDSLDVTGRIFDRLVTHYGRDAVFRDIDSILPGVDFRDQINQFLDQSDILLAIIGPKWLGLRAGQSRLSDEGDPVRVELEMGLRKKLPVVPVLVLRAPMPRVAQLPETLKDFAFRHAVTVDSQQDFDQHCLRLIRAIDRLLKQGEVEDAQGSAASGARQQGPDMVSPEITAPAIPVEDDNSLSTSQPDSLALALVPVPEFAPHVSPRPDSILGTAHGQRRAGGIALALGAGAILGAVVAAAVTFSLRPPVPSDIAGLTTAKEAVEARLASLQADFIGTQKKAAAAQEELAAAQKQVADQTKQLSDLQASADRAAKDLAAQMDVAAKSQTQLDESRKELAAQKDAAVKIQSQLDQANRELAAQKTAVAQAQTQIVELQGQLKTLADQLAAEKKADQAAVDQVAQLNGKIKQLQEQGAAQPSSATSSATALGPIVDDSAWAFDQRREVQNDLVTLGHLQGSVDGNFGATTRAAIKQFQSFTGDSETGVMTDAERGTLRDTSQRLTALLARGETSPDGVSAAVVKGSAQRYQRAWAAEKGTNGAADPAEAIYWYGLAASDGDSKALTNLGTLLVRGLGVAKPDPSGAALLWWAAAARGEATAMFNLGALWEHGIGVATDLSRAKAWYQRAAAKNDQGAQAALKRLGT
jgi:TPR repeat protein